jgi:peptide/nickel transport system ATP-binding protein
MMANSGLLSVQDLSVTFRRVEPGGHVARIPVLRRVSLDMGQGEIVAVVGSSGAGKSILAHAILGVLPGNAEVDGRILFRGQELTPDRLVAIRGREIALVPQSISFLDPLVKAKHAVQLAARRAGLDKGQARAAQEDAFSRLGLSPEAGDRYPFELSGGMARRVLLAMATVGNPSLLVADEPTPGLHESAVRESLSRLRKLADTGKSVLLISHDIVSCLAVADRVAVFLDGEVVEIAAAAEFSRDGLELRHPYSQALWNALPQNAFTSKSDKPTTPSRPGRADGHRTASIEDAHAEGA